MVKWIAVMLRQGHQSSKMRRCDRDPLKTLLLDLPLDFVKIGPKFSDPHFDRDLPKRNDADQNFV